MPLDTNYPYKFDFEIISILHKHKLYYHIIISLSLAALQCLLPGRFLLPDKVKGRSSEDNLLCVTGRMNNLRTLIVSTLQIAIVKTLIRGDTSPYLAPAPALELETNLRKV